MMNRRAFLGYTAAAGVATILPGASFDKTGSRAFSMSLRAGSVGIGARITSVIDLAAQHGFEAICPDTNELSRLAPAEREQVLERMATQNLKWGCAGLPVNFRADAATFEAGLEALPQHAQALQAMGVRRVGTWLLPKHASLSYLQNFQQHARRLRRVAEILDDAGLRLGLEYVGPRTFQPTLRHNFVRSLPETPELIDAIGMPNVGVVLDSFHWFTAQDPIEEVRALNNNQVVACDLNDARIGFASHEQIDNRRMLPASTGVIDIGAFMQALAAIGYDGPVRAEPFNAPLNAMNDTEAAAATAEAMRAAFATL